MKLVLFDIDGTLISHIETNKKPGLDRFIYAAKVAYGVDLKPVVSRSFGGGHVDRSIFAALLEPHHITADTIRKNFPVAAEALYEHAIRHSSDGSKLHKPIAAAVELAQKLSRFPGIVLGLLTGNVRKMAYWKLTHANIDPGLFKVGVFADDFDDRISLAKSVFDVAYTELGRQFRPDDIYIIGDAEPDVRCAKAIGAWSVIVLSGYHHSLEGIQKESPDLIVDSLGDPKVWEYLTSRQFQV
jgi:phosphoglycolate phosphatase